MFFDVTTLSFESQVADDLKEFGYSEDHKFNEVQVVLALVTTTNGLPITYRLFPGNKFEGHTLIPVIKELQEEFKIENIFLAADRGMFTTENLEQMDSHNIKYVVGAKLKTMTKVMKQQILFSKAVPGVVENEFVWLKELKHNERRLIVSYSANRAKKDAGDRKRLIDRLMKKMKKGKLQLKDLVSNYGSKKYIKTDGKTEVSINEAKLQEDAQWDGLHGVITNSNLTKNEILERYKGLWQIEEAFRVNKSTLKMRPIYHWTSRRIKGHICYCYITYSVIKHIQFRLKENNSSLTLNSFLEALNDMQASIVINKFSKKKYLLPSNLTDEAKEICKIFNIKRQSSIQPL